MIEDSAKQVPLISRLFIETLIEIFSTLGKLAKRIPNYAKELEPLHSEGGGSSSVSIQKKLIAEAAESASFD
jgi:hypothetical protein